MNRIAVIVIVTGIVRVKVIAIVRVMALPARCAVRRRKEKNNPRCISQQRLLCISQLKPCISQLSGFKTAETLAI
jgi:hypothetical protein